MDEIAQFTDPEAPDDGASDPEVEAYLRRVNAETTIVEDEPQPMEEENRTEPEEEPDGGYPPLYPDEGPRRSLLETIRPHKKFIAAVMAMVMVTGVVTAALLFNQSLQPPGTTPASLTKNCDPVPPTPANVVKGTSGYVTWQCTATQGAIHVNGVGTFTPTITKGSEWVGNLFIYGNGPPPGHSPPTTSCGSAFPVKELVSGTPVTFESGDQGDWSYCHHYADAPDAMTPITVSWNT